MTTSSNPETVELSTLPTSNSAEMIISSNPEIVDLSPLLPAEMITSSKQEIVESSTLRASDSAERITSSNPERVELSTLQASDSEERITSSNPERVELSTLQASDSEERITSSNLGDLSTLFPASDSAERITSSKPEIMHQRLDLESGTIDELYKPNPGMWQVRSDPNLCCIYRVPDCMRHINPEAYTPQLVLIGPLHHSLKSKALTYRGDITNTKAMNYLNMERHKKIYLAQFARRRVGSGEKEVIDEFREIIKEEEGMIRASYSESTDWISSSDFVEMIMLDCVFVIEFILKWNIQLQDMLKNTGSSSSTYAAFKPSCKTGDPLMDQLSLLAVVRRDLTMLENQIPYYMFEKLYGVCIKSSLVERVSSFRKLVDLFFSESGVEIKDDLQFKHFTDMVRCGLVETLPEHFLKDFYPLEDTVMHHADKLHSGGVKFKTVDTENFLNVEFKNGCLHIPCFSVDDTTEETLRNIIALEQCHYCYDPHVSNYITFLDFLIDTEKDVALLVEKGIISYMVGDYREVATMVNRLCVGVADLGSHYSFIAKDVQNYYNNPWTKSSVILRTVYFSNMWRGTATIAATLLLLLTLVQTLFSILQFLSSS